MPTHLVERINASLAAEQAQRATSMPGASATPLLATARRRRSRLVFAVAGAAAAVAAVAVVGTTMFTARQSTTISSGAAIARSAATEKDSGGVPQSAAKEAPKLAAGAATTPTVIHIALSRTRYTQAGFVVQAQTLSGSAAAARPQAEQKSAALGPIGTVLGLKECLDAIGAGGAQVVRADVAFYEGRAAVIIVATTNGRPVAYAVGRQCSGTDAALLRPATPLP
jgi:hypothetical protein